MPHANIWIRSDDLEKWEAIEKKSEFISEALNGVPPSQAKESPLPDSVKERVERHRGFCQHGYAVGLCKFGCKK